MSNELDPKLDRWLDEAMEQYGSAEPRLGMEARIMARLHQEQRRFFPHWRFVGVAAAVAVAAMALVVSFHSRRVEMRPGRIAAQNAPKAVQPTISVELGAASQAARGPGGVNKKVPGMVAVGLRKNASRRLRPPAIFAAPANSQQAKLLLAFVREAPQEAAQIAAAQQEFEEQGTIARLPLPTPISIQPLQIESEDKL